MKKITQLLLLLPFSLFIGKAFANGVEPLEHEQKKYSSIQANYKKIDFTNSIETITYLCDSNRKCQNYTVKIFLPIKKQYAQRNIVKELIAKQIDQSIKYVNGKSLSKDNSFNNIEMDIKGQLYRGIDQIDRNIKDKILEKYLIEVKIQK